MSDSKVIIHDYTSLIKLNESLDYCSDSLLKILNDVDIYLQNVLQALQQQADFLKKEVDRLELELEEAKRALYACEDSQMMDEDGYFYPSCDYERETVASTQHEYNDFQKKHDNACKLFSECKFQIDAYKEPYSLVTSGGGEKTLEYLANTHTDEADNKMNQIIEIVEEYLGKKPHKETNKNESLSYEKEHHIKKTTDKIKQKQKKDSYSHKIADANIAITSPNCKRARPICICGRTRKK